MEQQTRSKYQDQQKRWGNIQDLPFPCSTRTIAIRRLKNDSVVGVVAIARKPQVLDVTSFGLFLRYVLVYILYWFLRFFVQFF